MYKCKHFKISELVDPVLLKRIGEKTAWVMLDERLLKCADLIRKKYGVCTVNASGLTNCGLRDFDSIVGAKYSMHKLGKALDIHIKTIETKYKGDAKTAAYNKVRQELMKLTDFDVLSFEDNISWLHIDVGNRDKRLFNP